jgi:hypothetical protein
MSVQITGAQIKNDAIDNSKIADDAVQEAQIQSSAVTAAKIQSGAVTSAKLGSNSVTSAKIAPNAVTSGKMDLTGTFDFSSGTLQAGTPSNASDVTNKSYVDGLVGSGVYWKEPARVASTANVTISNPGTDTFDGVQIASGDRILLKDQTSQAENGVYDFNGSSSALTRSSDANSADELNGLAIFVKEGTANADQGYVQTSEIANLGSDNVVFAQFTGLGQITAGNGLSKSGNTLSVDAGDGLSFDAGQLEVELGAGLEFQAGAIDIEVDDSTLEVDAGSNELRVKDSGITSAKIATNAVTGNEIAALAVSSANLADSAVSSAKIGASAVTEAKIASNAVSSAKIATNAVTGQKISAGVAGAGLGKDGSSNLEVKVDDSTIEIVTDSLQLKNLGVSSAKLADSAVSTAKIANASVTGPKLAATVAGTGLVQNGSGNLDISAGDGLQFSGNDITVDLGAGLEIQAGSIEVEVDDSTIEVDGVSNEVQVKDLGITSGKLANSAVSTAKIADDAVTAAKVGFQAYQELTTVSGGSTLNIDLAREVDSAFSNGIMAFKNGLALLNQTALGGSASNSDQFTLSVVGGVTRLSFGAALADADNILIVYMA